MNNLLVNKSASNAKMVNAKMSDTTINKKIAVLNKKIDIQIAALNKKTATLNTKTATLNTQTAELITSQADNVRILENFNTSQDSNLIAKMLLAEKTRYEKSKISTRLTLIELYKIESDATKRNHLIRLINRAINS